MGNGWKHILYYKVNGIGTGRGNGQTLGPGLEFWFGSVADRVSSRRTKFTEGYRELASCQGALISWAKSQGAPQTINMNLAIFVSLPYETSGSWRSFAIGSHFLGFFWALQTAFPHLGRSLGFLHPSLPVAGLECADGELSLPSLSLLSLPNSNLLSPTPEALKLPGAMPPPPSPILKALSPIKTFYHSSFSSVVSLL